MVTLGFAVRTIKFTLKPKKPRKLRKIKFLGGNNLQKNTPERSEISDYTVNVLQGGSLKVSKK